MTGDEVGREKASCVDSVILRLAFALEVEGPPNKLCSQPIGGRFSRATIVD